MKYSSHIFKTLSISIGLLTISYTLNATPGILDKLFKNDTQEQVDNEPQLRDLSFKEIRLQPRLGKQSEAIRAYQKEIAIKLKKDNPRIELMRNGEVIIISISTDQLFMPDEYEISKSGERVLTKYLDFFDKPDFYRIVLAMCSDNTGTSEYIHTLASNRINNIYKWYSTRKPNNKFIFPYAIGLGYPLKKNNSMDNRAYNRRLEIYLVPGDLMISAAKEKAL